MGAKSLKLTKLKPWRQEALDLQVGHCAPLEDRHTIPQLQPVYIKGPLEPCRVSSWPQLVSESLPGTLDFLSGWRTQCPVYNGAPLGARLLDIHI